MTPSSLPLFHIPDFGHDSLDSAQFYYAGLKTHLATHQFIQRPHKHDFYIIVVFTQGTGSHTIDFKKYSVEKGSVFFLSPGQVHSWKLSSDTDGHILFFSSDFYSSTFSRKRLSSYSLFNSITEFPPLELDSKEAKEVIYVFERTYQEIKIPNIFTTELLKNYIDTVLIYFHRYKGNKISFSNDEQRTHVQFQQIESLIDNHYKEHREAVFYGDKMKMSLKQLNALCKKCISKTSSQLIMERVILEAKRLLTHSDLNISQIAYELKFEDASYFSRLFKKKTTLTPDQFRRQLENS